jgi:hypothetical protein
MRPIHGQPVVIENVGGPACSLGVGRTVHAAPDIGRAFERATRNDDKWLYPGMRSSFCRQRTTFTSGGIGVSGKLVFQSVTPTSPT